MKKSTMIMGSLVLMPTLAFAQFLGWENGRTEPSSVVACNGYNDFCVNQGDGQTCTRECVSFISSSQLINVIQAHSVRSHNLEASVASVRQDFQPSIQAQSSEINHIKTSLSTAEIQRMVQRMVREELNQRGL